MKGERSKQRRVEGWLETTYAKSRAKTEGAISNNESSQKEVSAGGQVEPTEVLALEADEEDEVNDAEEGDTAALEAMLDGGSNVNLFTSKLAMQHATFSTGEPRKVTGIFGQKGEGLKQFKLQIELTEAQGDSTMQIDGLFSEQGRRDILSESWLYDKYGARVLKEPVMKIKSPTFEAPIIRRGGHYFVEYNYAELQQARFIENILWGAVKTKPDDEVNVAGMSRTLSQVQLAHCWAARLGGGERSIRGLLNATKGHGLTQVTAEMVRRAESDTYLRRANQRTKPSVRVHEASRREPGELFVLDAWGPSQAKSPLDGSRYHLTALCARTSEGHHAASRGLTTEIWLQFIKWFVAREAALGHQVRVVRLDACPELKEGWLSKIEQCLARESPPIKVERAAGGHHEGVGLVEQFNGQATRMAEAALARARMGQSWIIPCRMYQAALPLSLRCRRGASKTRSESHTGREVDLEKQTPFCFGTKVAYLTDENFPTRREDAGRQRLAASLALAVTTVRAPRLDREACGRLADRCDAAAARRELAGHLLGAALLWRIGLDVGQDHHSCWLLELELGHHEPLHRGAPGPAQLARHARARRQGRLCRSARCPTTPCYTSKRGKRGLRS